MKNLTQLKIKKICLLKNIKIFKKILNMKKKEYRVNWDKILSIYFNAQYINIKKIYFIH